MYKIVKLDDKITVVKQEGNVKYLIPPIEDNTDYQEYLKWVAEGNTAEEITE